MQSKEILIIALLLLAGAVANYLCTLLFAALSVPFEIEFIIIAYCLVVMLLSPRLGPVICIGIIAAILNIVSDPTYGVTLAGGQLAMPEDLWLWGLFSFVSEPVGILVCSFSFAYLVAKAGRAAPLVSGFLATVGSGFAYLIMAVLFASGQVGTVAPWVTTFILTVLLVAVMNAVIIQVLYLVLEKPVRSTVAGTAG